MRITTYYIRYKTSFASIHEAEKELKHLENPDMLEVTYHIPPIQFKDSIPYWVRRLVLKYLYKN